MLPRPRPPEDLCGLDGAMAGPKFIASPELTAWAIATFIADDAPLHNEDHIHLQSAQIGALWTNAPNSRYGRTVAGQAETGKPSGSLGGKWTRAKFDMLLDQWFGGAPDFVITFYAEYAAECSDIAFCALVEHELYHCGQERDRDTGAPVFRKSGLPAFCIRGHDVEEFIGVVKRYGAIDPGVKAMAEAAIGDPAIAAADIRAACGTCP